MIHFAASTLTVDGREFEFEYPILDVVEYVDRLILLFDPDAYTEKFGQFANLVSVTREGKRLWTAEAATTTSGDRYYRLDRQETLKAYSIYSVVCEIDVHTGKILTREFVK